MVAQWRTQPYQIIIFKMLKRDQSVPEPGIVSILSDMSPQERIRLVLHVKISK